MNEGCDNHNKHIASANRLYMPLHLLLFSQSCPTLCDCMHCSIQASLSITSSRSPPKLMTIELIMPSNYLIFCPPLLLPSIFLSTRVFSSESALCIRWPKCWSFSISPFSEYSGLISFRIDWFGLLAQVFVLGSKSTVNLAKKHSCDLCKMI